MATMVEAPEVLIRLDMLQMRYADAYTVAHGIISLADLVKVVGVGLGILIGGASIALSGQDSSVSHVLLAGGCIAGLLIAVAGYVTGVAIGARGQMMLATVDTAVNTSTLLSQSHKAEILGIRA